jgi:23S rRNA pseudouridine1911/1915/1917 synthase
MSGEITLVVEAADAGQRVDVVLGRRVAGLSRRAARALGLRGRIRIADERSPPSRAVKAGDVVTVELRDAVAPHDGAASLVVLAQTDDFVYVDKPAGIHTHRLGPDEPPALADAVVERFADCASASRDPREGGAIARLDRETSGVVAFARSARAWRLGRAAMSDMAARKHYLAVCTGVPAEPWPPAAQSLERIEPAADAMSEMTAWWIHWPSLPQPRSIAPARLRLSLGHGTDRGRVAVRADGRATTTVLAPLATRDGARTLFAVTLGRGFRHQIRVVLAWLGLPIEGDVRYGSASGDAPLLLHCAQLDLSACCAGEQRVAAPLPAHWADAGLASPAAAPSWQPFAGTRGA